MKPLVGRHVGMTPLVRARNLEEPAGGFAQLYLKNDAVCHPTWSFKKDRVVSVAVSKARELGLDTVACASTGNLANSVAAHAAEARFPARLRVHPESGSNRARCRGRWSTRPVSCSQVEGTYDDVNRLCSELADRHAWGFIERGPSQGLYAAEGVQDRTATRSPSSSAGASPAHVVVPCAGGALLTKIRKAFAGSLAWVSSRGGHPGCTRRRRPAAAPS